MENERGSSDMSDRDREMMGRKSFESSGESKEKKKKSKKGNKEKPPRLFEKDFEEDAETADKKPRRGFLELFTKDKEEKQVELQDPTGKNPKTAETIDESSEAAAQAELESLDQDESRRVAEEYIEVRQSELENAVTDEPIEAAANEADQSFLDKLEEFVRSGEALDGALDKAYAEAAEDIGFEEEMPQSNEALPGQDEEFANEATDDNADEKKENDDAATTRLAQTQARSTSTPNPTTLSTGGAGTQPPGSPAQAGGFASPPMPPIAAPNPTPNFAGGRNANVMPVNPNIIHTRSRAGDLLVGGFLGYLLGRRKGRIKTEERLGPIQKKLEAEVKSLHKSIETKETEIRGLAAKTKQAELSAATQKQNAVQPQTTQSNRKEAPGADGADLSYPKTKPKETVPESLETFPVPVSSSIERHEPRVNSSAPEFAGTKQQDSLERRETNTREIGDQEILQVAKNIKTGEGTTAEQLYNNRRITKEGLRKVVSEYLKGGNVARVLSQEIIGEERMKERALEHEPKSSHASPAAKETGDDRMQPIGALLPAMPASAATEPSQNGDTKDGLSRPNAGAQGSQFKPVQKQGPNYILIIIAGIIIAGIISTILL